MFKINRVESEKYFLKSISIYEKLVTLNPELFEPELAKTESNIADLYRNNQDLVKAEKYFRKSIETWERLVKTNSAEFEFWLAVSLNNFGEYWKDIKKFEVSQEFYGKSRKIFLKSIYLQIASNCRENKGLYPK